MNAVTALPQTNIWTKIKTVLTYPNKLLIAILFICFIIGPLNKYSMLLSVAMVPLIVLLWKYDEFYLLLGVFLYFQDQFNITQAMPVYRIFTYLVLLKIIFKWSELHFRTQYIPTFLIFIIYLSFVIVPYNVRVGLATIIDISLSFLITQRLRDDKNLFHKLLIVIAICGVLSGIYALTSGTVMSYENDSGKIITRYLATFSDPNIAGLFINIAITAALNIKVKWYIRIPILGMLYYTMLLFNSFTAMLTNVIVIIVFIIMRFPKQSPIVLGVALCSFVTASLAIYNIPFLSHMPPFDTIIVRVNQQLKYLAVGDFNKISTFRLDIWNYYFDYFKSQPLVSKLFGGNMITTMFLDKQFDIGHYGACHNIYLQGLLNMGIIGDAIIIFTLFSQTISEFMHGLSKSIKSMDKLIFRSTAIFHIIWIVYGLSVDYYFDWRSVVILFI